MRILLLGGYGVFGSRLARLLVADNHDVCIAGRNLKAAQSLADELGCAARQFDRTGSLETLSNYQVVIDAAGPFHAYGSDPYRLPRAALAARLHYLDLSDNAAFCTGIADLDPQAKSEACVFGSLGAHTGSAAKQLRQE